jgi:transketolase
MAVPYASGSLDDGRLTALARGLRRDVIDTLWHAQAGHPGGSLSAVEILAALFFRVMRVNPADPLWEQRDRFVLSKGHASTAYYVTLSRRGFFPAEVLPTYDEIDSCLQAHPDCHTPGVDMPSGSLGQGLSAGLGMALGLRLKGYDSRAFVLLGDGECQEGQIWEAAMAAPKFRLGNLTAIVDVNKVQLTGHTADVMPIEPLADKWRAFNWNVVEVDGHSIPAIAAACERAAALPETPTAILAHTVKGKGVSFMEDTHTWHSAVVTDEVRRKALAELDAAEVAG